MFRTSVGAAFACALVSAALPRPGSAQSESLPLAAPDTMRFTATEGTWISLDVAPHGRTIVFELLGDLYLLPVGGGRTTRLTSGSAFDAQPRFSPDGEWILFVSDRDGAENIWIIKADGTSARPITRGRDTRYSSPAWMPDGRSVIVSRGRTVEQGTHYPERLWSLVRFELAGGTGVVLEPAAGSMANNFLGAAPSPDGRYLYMSGRQGELATAVFVLPLWDLYSFDLLTGTVAPVSPRRGGGMRPAISRDGRWLVFGTRRDRFDALRIRDLKSGEERWLTSGVDKDEQETLWQARDLLPGGAFLPDNSAFITSHGGKIWRLEVPSGRATEIPFSADVALPITPKVAFTYRVNDDARVTAMRVNNPAISPNGRQVAFAAVGRLWVADLSNGVGRPLTDGTRTVDYPTWSPDGRLIAFASWSESEGGAIERVAADGSSRPERLTRDGAYYERVAYLAGGTRLVAVTGRAQARLEELNEPTRLVWIPADGGTSTVVAPIDGASATRPHVGPDPDRIYLADARNGLYSVRFDGTDQQTHVTLAGWVTSATMSPDGRHLVVGAGVHTYLVTVPSGLGKFSVDVRSPAAGVPVRKLSEFGAEHPSWSPDGSTVSYVLGRTLFSHRLAGPDTTVRELALEAKVSRDKPEGTVVLRGARVLTMARGAPADGVLPNADVVVTGNRIVAVGARGRVSVPPGARVIDVTGKTLLPGWVDIHAHIAGQNGVPRGQRWDYLSYLAYGVTTTRDPSQVPIAFGYYDMVEAGSLLGPRIYTTGMAISPLDNIRSLDDARRTVRRYSKYYDTRYIKQYGAGERRVRQWLMMAAREQEITAVVEPYMDIKKNITEVMDGYPELAHNIARSPIYDDLIRLMAQQQVALTQTFVVTAGAPMGRELFYTSRGVAHDAKARRFRLPQEFERYTLRTRVWFDSTQYLFSSIARDLAAITARGGRPTLGGHGEAQGLGVHWELEMMASGGMPLIDVIRAGTLNAAEAIGLATDLGSIEVGKLADLQILDRDPLVSITNTTTVRQVMKNGRLYETERLREVWPRQRDLAPLWWWNEPEEPTRSR